MPSTSPEPLDTSERLTALYDGDCPLCSREIAWYRRHSPGEDILWVDLTRCEDAALPRGIDRDAALRRFHVVEPDGRPVTGAAAFVRLWSAYPRLAGHARLARLPGMLPLLELGYRLFLRLRPLLVRALPAPRPHGGELP